MFKATHMTSFLFKESETANLVSKTDSKTWKRNGKIDIRCFFNFFFNLFLTLAVNSNTFSINFVLYKGNNEILQK